MPLQSKTTVPKEYNKYSDGGIIGSEEDILPPKQYRALRWYECLIVIFIPWVDAWIQRRTIRDLSMQLEYVRQYIALGRKP